MALGQRKEKMPIQLYVKKTIRKTTISFHKGIDGCGFVLILYTGLEFDFNVCSETTKEKD